MKKKRNIVRRVLSLLLTLCMVLNLIPVMGTVAKAAVEPVVDETDKIITVEKYYIDENDQVVGEFLRSPMRVANFASYGPNPIINALGNSNIQFQNDQITAFKDESQSDGYLNNGDFGEGSKWIFATDGERGYEDDTAYTRWKNVKVIRIMYLPDGNDMSVGFDGAHKIAVNKDELIEYLSRYNGVELSGNRQAAYNAALATVVNPTASAEDVSAALSNFQNATDNATSIKLSVGDQEDVGSIEMYAGEQKQVTATVEPAGTTDDIEWTSANENIASVEDGLVTGVNGGQTTITVTAGEVSTELEVKILPITSISIASMPQSDIHEIAAQTQSVNLLATVYKNENGETLDVQKIDWSVSDPEVASIEIQQPALVEIKGLKAGSVRVTAKIGTVKQNYDITVTPYQGPYVYFEYSDGRKKELDQNNCMELSALDEGRFVLGRDNGSVTWNCSEWVTIENGGDNSGEQQQWVAFIGSENGKFNPYGIREKTAVVTSTTGYSAEFTLKCVSSGITELKTYVGNKEVTENDPYVTEGTVSGVPVTVKGKTADEEWVTIPTQALEFRSSDTTAHFRFLGNTMTITSGGSATMRVYLKEDKNIRARFKAECTYVPLQSFTLNVPSTCKITGFDQMYGGLQGVGQDYLYPVCTPSNATNKNINWESLTPDIAIYRSDHQAGLVPYKAGTARFKATSADNPNLSQEVQVVFTYKTPLTKMELSQTEYTVNNKSTTELNIKATPSNATDQRFNWSYDISNIVQVTDSIIYSSTDGSVIGTRHSLFAKNPGTVTVTGTPVDDTAGCNTIQFKVTVKGNAESSVTIKDYKSLLKNDIAYGLEYLNKLDQDAYGDEWTIFTILRAGGTISDSNRSAYLNSVEEELKKGLGVPSDYARVILTLGVMGEDATNFRGYNLVEKLYNWENLEDYGSNRVCWTLIALDSKNYEIPASAVWSREKLIGSVLKFQQENGAFGLSMGGGGTSVDMTGMNLQALAPYNNTEHPNVQAAFEKASEYLQSVMTEQAGFKDSGTENTCTTAQILTLLSVARIDPVVNANGYVRNGENMITNMHSYRDDLGGGFLWQKGNTDESSKVMSTQQTVYAFEAALRLAEGRNALYNLTDVKTSKPDVPVTPSDPSVPSNPSGPTNPDEPSNPDKPTDPDEPTNPPAPSTEATLSNLTISKGTLTPAFSADTKNYTAVVENAADSLAVNAKAADGATVTVNGKATSEKVALKVGYNTIKIQVTAEDGKTTDTYTIKVTRVVPKNYKITISGKKYQVTNARSTKGTVAITGLSDKKAETLSVPNTVKIYGITYKVTSVGKNAFRELSKLKTVKVGDNVTTIGYGAFYKCPALKSVTLGKNVKSIGDHAFCRDEKLRTLTLNGTALTKVGNHVLYKAANLTIKAPSSKVKAYKKLFTNQGTKSFKVEKK